MAKYDVRFSCGHIHTIELYGPTADRERKIKYLEECGICPECREAEKAVDCEEVEMHYSEYKNNYSDCQTKANSYDKKTKTIIVYVPKKADEETAEENTEESEISSEYEAIKVMCKIFGVTANDNFISKCKSQLSKPYSESVKSFDKSSKNASPDKIKKGKEILEIIKSYKSSIGEEI